jgi:hypothetical protein
MSAIGALAAGQLLLRYMLVGFQAERVDRQAGNGSTWWKADIAIELGECVPQAIVVDDWPGCGEQANEDRDKPHDCGNIDELPGRSAHLKVDQVPRDRSREQTKQRPPSRPTSVVKPPKCRDGYDYL